jgi:hypothetical protein
MAQAAVRYIGDPVLSADGEIIHTPEQAAIDAGCDARETHVLKFI